MNITEFIIREFVSANIPLTTLVRTLKLQPETVETRISLKNLKKILNSPLEFEIKKITFYFEEHPRLHTEWILEDFKQVSVKKVQKV